MEIKIAVEQSGVTVTVDGVAYTKREETPDAKNLFDVLNSIHGAKEWDAAVGKIQTWYYGSYVKASWCATAVSWAANQLGILDRIGGKNENVYHMMHACAGTGLGQFFTRKAGEIPKQIKQGDILFYLWDGNIMTPTSNKHVSIAAEDTTSDKILSEGGNQKDKICRLYYDRDKLYALYRPYK